MNYNEHIVEWTDEKVARFWNFQENYEPFENIWFTKQVGKGLINFAKKHIKISGSILDYGAGKGHLIEHILNQKGTKVYGFDFSSESIINVKKKYDKKENFFDCTLLDGDTNYTQYESDKFDVVFLVETIEHLTDKYLNSTLTEIKRVLKKDGVVLISTPNNEKLEMQNVCCPDCGGIFHRVQHVRSFDNVSLSKLLSNFGFDKIISESTNLHNYNNPSAPRSILRNLVGKIRNKEMPHLIYIGKKNG